jgi:hypothetical protein
MSNIWIGKMTVVEIHSNRIHRPRLALLGEFALQINGDRVTVAPHLQRLLVLLSLSDTALSRRHISGVRPLIALESNRYRQRRRMR